MTECRRFIIKGKVQGVFFRASTQQKAHQLGITGYARNQSDGSVEVLACGEETVLEQLNEWLWQGPPAAKVLQVITYSSDWIESNTFTTG